MKNLIIAILILSLGLNSINSLAAPQPIGSAFSYQGILMDSGSPANGNYDIGFELFTTETGNLTLLTDEYLSVPVIDGQFNLPQVDFGDAVFAAGTEIWINLSITKTGSGLPYVDLSPRQRLNAVPYAVQAEFLAAGGATNGDVLQFNGSDWVASALSSTSPWNQSGTTLTSPGKVGIGEPIPSAQLHITNNSSQISLLKVDDTSATRMIVQATGRVGIGDNVNPSDRLHVNSAAGEHAFRVQVAGLTKLRVRSNGGTALGVNFTGVPTDGLYVQGNVKQLNSSNGMIKYMVNAVCSNSSNIISFYNGTENSGNVTISSDGTGECTITFPTDINNRYFQASPRTIFGNRSVSCGFVGTNQLSCNRHFSSTGNVSSGPIMVLIY